MIICANAASDSRVVEYVIRNFHEMDIISDDVDFFLPGYDIRNIQYEVDDNELDWRNNILSDGYQDYHGENSYTQGILSIVRKKRKFVRMIDSPPLVIL